MRRHDELAAHPSITVIAQSPDGGAFTVKSPTDGQLMAVIASWELGWDHVSVSRKTRAPNWYEMEHVANLFFLPDEWAVQFHVPRSEHVDIHSHCLHWWRSQEDKLAIPPSIMV